MRLSIEKYSGLISKKYFLSLVIFCFCGGLFGQTSFGLRGGLNYSNVNFSGLNNAEDRSYLPGYHGGFFLGIPFNDKFYLETNLRYSREGFRFNNQPFSRNAKVLMHYIDVPILLSYQIIPKIKIKLGPDVGYLFSVREKTEIYNRDVSASFSRKIRIAGVVEINYTLTDKISINAGFVQNINRLNKDTEVTIIDEQGTSLGVIDVKARSHIFQLSLQYKF